MDAATVERLRREPVVRYVEQSVPVRPWDLITNPPSWGQDRIDQRLPPLNQKLELGWVIRPVAIYVMDSGIYNAHSNNWQARFHPGTCTHPSCTSPVTDSVIDIDGHGTHVAGTIGGNRFGISKDVDVYSVRVFINNNTTLTAIFNGINWIVAQNRPRSIVNMSFGSVGAPIVALDSAVRDMIVLHGITAVVAAGNEGVDACTRSPSAVTQAIVVGATNAPSGASDPKAPYSNVGSCVDLFAPGTNIVSAWIGNTSAQMNLSGTSMAAPHVTGVVALYASQGVNPTPAALEFQLLQDVTTGTITNAGAGSPNRMLFLKGMADGRAKGLLAVTAAGVNPMFGVKDDGQLFMVYLDGPSGLLQVGNITNVKVIPGSLALGSSGDDVWGVRPDLNLEHFWWSASGWHSETVQVWGGGADPTSLVSTGQANPVFGIKTNGQVFLVWRDVPNNAWGVGSIRDVTARVGSLRVAKDGSLFGVRPDANIFQAWWSSDQWWEVTINVW